MTGRVLPFRPATSPDPNSAAVANGILETPRENRLVQVPREVLLDPEILLSICALLRARIETNPARIRDDAEFFYRLISESETPIGLFDEKDYFLGEMSLIAGCACRFLFRRDEARRWFDRSESAFRQTVNAVGDWSRVSYQRLALRVEDREFEQVLELLPSLIETFRKLRMHDDALKCRFLEGVSYINMDLFDKAVRVFQGVCAEAQAIGNEALLAAGCNNLVQLQGLIGNSEDALATAQETLKLFYKLDNQVGLAKLQWGIGTLMRTQGNLAAAAEAYGAAQQGFRKLEMVSDVAALCLVIADIRLETGDEPGALREILAALPIIQKEGMIPEGFAAMSLLQESIRNQRIDRGALRQLHGYFGENSS